MAKEVAIYHCPWCGWQSEPNIGMKNECPDCGKYLMFVCGTNEEIDEWQKT